MDFIDPYDHITPGLVYSPSNIPGAGTSLSKFDLLGNGCDCTTDCSSACSHLAFHGGSYVNGCVSSFRCNLPLFECNSSCLCEPSRCTNRLVQRGPSIQLKIAPIVGKGLGLVALSSLKQGQFVCEYAGEIIDEQTARARFAAQMRDKKPNYILVVREYSGVDLVNKTIVDPTG